MKLLMRWKFILIILIVVIIQFSLLRVILNNGFTADDWLLLFDYKTIAANANFLDKLAPVYYIKGIYTAYQVLYIGALESLFKGNYLAYQITNIILKTLATLSLYPLIIVVFRRRLLAFLTTLFYAISYSSAGALQFVIKGSDYLAIFFMNMCLLAYYYSFKTKRKILLLVTTILLFLSFVFSPIRMYPFLLLVILIEIFMWIKSRRLIVGLIFTILRLTLFFTPFLILMLFLPKSTTNYLNGPLVVYKFISYGNYQLLLSPFAGLGYTFLTNDYWGIFGKVSFDSFRDYLLFLIQGPAIIYTLFTIAIGFLITKRPAHLILSILFANFIFELLCYFLINNLRLATGPNVKGFYPISTYAIFFGFYIITIAFSALVFWFKKNKSNLLLLSLFIGPIFSSIFLWGTWFLIGDVLTFKEGIHWYLIIPPIGSSLFLGSLMVLGFDRIKNVVKTYRRSILTVSLFLVIVPIYLISNKEINTTFTDLLHIGYGASDQEEIKNKLISHIKNPYDEKPKLFYFEISEDLDTPALFYPVTIISGFEQKMHFYNWEIVNGCVSLIYNKDKLKKAIVIKDGIKGFTTGSLCVENYSLVGNAETFYNPENFFAFKLKNKNFVDIKNNVLEELKF